MTAFPDSAEEFVSLSGDNSALDAMFIAPPKAFEGKTLAPYGLGAEGIIDEALVGVKSDALYSLTFLQVLADFQEGLDRYGKSGWDGKNGPALTGDAQINAATADLMRAIHTSVDAYQARANTWRVKVGRKGVTKAVDLVNSIVKEAKDSELLAAEEPNEPGKASPPV